MVGVNRLVIRFISVDFLVLLWFISFRYLLGLMDRVMWFSVFSVLKDFDVLFSIMIVVWLVLVISLWIC